RSRELVAQALEELAGAARLGAARLLLDGVAQAGELGRRQVRRAAPQPVHLRGHALPGRGLGAGPEPSERLLEVVAEGRHQLADQLAPAVAEVGLEPLEPP